MGSRTAISSSVQAVASGGPASGAPLPLQAVSASASATADLTPRSPDTDHAPRWVLSPGSGLRLLALERRELGSQRRVLRAQSFQFGSQRGVLLLQLCQPGLELRELLFRAHACSRSRSDRRGDPPCVSVITRSSAVPPVNGYVGVMRTDWPMGAATGAMSGSEYATPPNSDLPSANARRTLPAYFNGSASLRAGSRLLPEPPIDSSSASRSVTKGP